MTVDVTPVAETNAHPSPDWLGRLQKALTVFLALALLAAGLTSAACVYAAVTADDNPLMYIVGDVDDLELAMELDAEARHAEGLPPEVAYGNPEGVLLQLYTALGWLPSLLVVAALLFVLRRTIRRARASDAFTEETAGGLRLAGRLALVGGALAWLAEWAARSALNTATFVVQPGEELFRYVPFSLRALIVDLPWLWILVGVALLAIAGVFSRGVAMRRDLEGLV